MTAKTGAESRIGKVIRDPPVASRPAPSRNHRATTKTISAAVAIMLATCAASYGRRPNGASSTSCGGGQALLMPVPYQWGTTWPLRKREVGNQIGEKSNPAVQTVHGLPRP